MGKLALLFALWCLNLFAGGGAAASSSDANPGGTRRRLLLSSSFRRSGATEDALPQLGEPRAHARVSTRAEAGGGWVSYSWRNDESSAIRLRGAYIIAVQQFGGKYYAGVGYTVVTSKQAASPPPPTTPASAHAETHEAKAVVQTGRSTRGLPPEKESQQLPCF